MSDKLKAFTVKIKYWGDDPPEVEAPDFVDIELIDGEEERWLFMEYAGVFIYHTIWKDDCFADHWFSLYRNIEACFDDAFDVRDIPKIPKSQLQKYYELFPGDPRKRTLAYAIDQGWITKYGVNIPPEAK